MALAAQASVAIENAYLYTSLREERDRILKAEEELLGAGCQLFWS